MDIERIAKDAKASSIKIAKASTGKKNSTLKKMASLLDKHKKEIIEANKKDLDRADKEGLPENIIKRLVFGSKKLDSRINSIRRIIELPDPVGQIRRMEKMPNGLLVGRMRVPFGVIMMIYEARPHVTINAGSFAIKSGNSILLKGGKEARFSNCILSKLWKDALATVGLPDNTIQFLTITHEETAQMLKLTDYIDIVIPRGGKGLIRSIVEKSRIPVIKHFEGICHIYIDGGADIRKAKGIVLDSKSLMPEVCNAVETLLISEDEADNVSEIIDVLKKEGVEVRGCKKTRSLVQDILSASKEDWSTEYLDKIISIKIVKDIGQAISHINRYGSGHTDAIVSEDYSHAQRFLKEVDSAVVLVNASTMFDDGEELGMGAEIGISTDKLHARGPMGLEELTSYKFVILGEGHVKKR